MYEWRKGIASWVDSQGTLYLSVPFTWLLEKAEKIAREWHGKVLIGGSGLMKPTQCDGYEPVLFHNACATFTTRGCPNSCKFCAVPRLEGDLKEISDFRPAPIICDNNFLAASKKHIKRVVDKLTVFPFVDFNQGLEARRFTPDIADELGRLNCHVRFAFDHWGSEAVVKDAIDLCRQRTTSKISVYALIGFDDDPESARSRLELIRSWGVLPNPMRYQPLDAKRKNEYVHPNWTERELANTMRYYSRLNWLGHIPFSKYKQRNFGTAQLIRRQDENK